MTGALDLLGNFGELNPGNNSFGAVPGGGTFTGNYVGLGNLCLSPVGINTPTRITQMGAPVSIAGEAGSVVRHGIYSLATVASPSVLNLVADYGVSASSAVADAVYGPTRTDILLNPGLYWFGAVSQLCPVTPPTLFYVTPNKVLWTPQQQFPNGVCYVQSGVTGALPTTITMSTLNSGGLCIRQMIKTGVA